MKTVSLLCLLLLAGCSGPTQGQWALILDCPAYRNVWAASTGGYAPGAPVFLRIVDDSLPDGRCAVATRMYDDLDEPYADMFPQQRARVTE